MSIVRLGPSSADDMAALHAQCFNAGWSAVEFSALLHLASSDVRGERKHGRLHGFILCRKAVDEAEILTICVDPGRQGQGLGFALLETAHMTLAEAGIQRVFLEVSTQNSAARALYQRAAYREIARRKAYYRDGTDAIVLEKSLVERGQA